MKAKKQLSNHIFKKQFKPTLKDIQQYQEEHENDECNYEGGISNFFEAICNDCVKVLEEHFRRGERKLNENYFLPDGHVVELPLINAISNHSYNSIIILLKHGADPDAFCKQTKLTPCQYAETKWKTAWKMFKAYNSGMELIPMEQEFEDDCYDEKLEDNNIEDEELEYDEGELNFFEAIESNNINILKKHFNKDWNGFNKNFHYPIPPGFDFELPLIIAIKCKAYNVLKLLLENKEDPNIVCNEVWMSPRQFAKENDDKAYQIICEFEK